MFQRIFPGRLDNDGYRGQAAALWLFAFLLLLKVIMGVNGAINTRSVATGADGIRLDGLAEGAAQTILLLFRNLSLAQLPLVAIGIAALWRWRSMVPFLFLVLLAELLVRRLASLADTGARTGAASPGTWINLALLALLAAGFLLSLWSHRKSPRLAPDPDHGDASLLRPRVAPPGGL